MSNTKEHKQCPLPPKGVEGNAECKPPDQLKIGEEVESGCRCKLLKNTSHVNPTFHPEGAWSGEGIGEEHKEDTSVYSDVPVSDRSDCIYICATRLLAFCESFSKDDLAYQLLQQMLGWFGGNVCKYQFGGVYGS